MDEDKPMSGPLLHISSVQSERILLLVVSEVQEAGRLREMQ